MYLLHAWLQILADTKIGFLPPQAFLKDGEFKRKEKEEPTEKAVIDKLEN